MLVPFDEIVPGATARLCVIDNVQYLSTRDVIMHIGGHSSKTANKTWERFSPEDREELATYCRQFRFPGPGNPTPSTVITFQGAIKLAMKLGGENAKKYRSAMTSILTRYYAGDGSLLEEVEANAQSNAPVAQMARGSLAQGVADDRAIAGEDLDEDEDNGSVAGGSMACAEDLGLKRKWMELEFSEKDIEITTKRITHQRHVELELKRMELELEEKAMEIYSKKPEFALMYKYSEISASKSIDEEARAVFKKKVLAMLAPPEPVASVARPAAAGLPAVAGPARPVAAGLPAVAGPARPVAAGLPAVAGPARPAAGGFPAGQDQQSRANSVINVFDIIASQTKDGVDYVEIGNWISRLYRRRYNRDPEEDSSHEHELNGAVFREQDRALVLEGIRWYLREKK